MVITKKALHRRTVLRGLGTTLALPLLDAMVPALARAQSGEGADAAVDRLRAERHHDGSLDPGHGRREFQAEADHGAARCVPGSDAGDLRSFPQSRRPRPSRREHGRSCPRRRKLSLRRSSEEDRRRGHARRHLDGSDRRKADRQQNQFASLELGVDSPELLGQCEAGYSCAYMNSICWRTPTHADADGKPSARRLRAAVRRFRKHRTGGASAPHPAGSQHSRFGHEEGEQL